MGVGSHFSQSVKNLDLPVMKKDRGNEKANCKAIEACKAFQDGHKYN